MKTDTSIIIREVTRYDGQNIWTDGEVDTTYELGSYLGGGAAGVVYEGVNMITGENVAVKILNPIGFKLTPSGVLQRYLVAVQGEPLVQQAATNNQGKQPGEGEGEGDDHHHRGPRRSSPAGHNSNLRRLNNAPLQLEAKNIWWLIHPSTREVLAAFLDPRFSKLREVPLTHCVQLWGWDADINPPRPGQATRADTSNAAVLGTPGPPLSPPTTGTPIAKVVKVRGVDVPIPTVPKKFVRFLKERRSIFREIASMSKIRGHPNCLKLEDVMELLNDSKSTIFLVLELAMGGELFDRIEIDRGTSEATARHYFSQLLEGLAHCHAQGVCHRDLKPENLLLADNEDNPALKIADFGLSALFRERELSQEEEAAALALARVSAAGGGAAAAAAVVGLTPTAATTAALVRLKSVVGSPHYVAPEILNGNSFGYEGAKADVWSAGVILYAMLAGNLPFGKEILKCPRFNKWKLWTEFLRKSRAREFVSSRNNNGRQQQPTPPEYIKPEPFPSWFFPEHFSSAAVEILTGLLEPEAELRMTVNEALQHEWVDPEGRNRARFQLNQTAAEQLSRLSLDEAVLDNATVLGGGSVVASSSSPGSGSGSGNGPSAPVTPSGARSAPPSGIEAVILEEFESMDSCKSDNGSNHSDRAASFGSEVEPDSSARHDDVALEHSDLSELSLGGGASDDVKTVTRSDCTTPSARRDPSSLDEANDDGVGMSAHVPTSQLSSLSLGSSTGSVDSAGAGHKASVRHRAALAEHMPFSSPPLAPRSVREMNNAHGDAGARTSGGGAAAASGPYSSSDSGMKRVNSLDDFALDGDSAWNRMDRESHWAAPPSSQHAGASGLEDYYTQSQLDAVSNEARQQNFHHMSASPGSSVSSSSQMPGATMVAQSPVLSFMSTNGAAQRAINAAELKDLKKFLEHSDDFFDPTLPVFHDLVQRSTRFATHVPAAEVCSCSTVYFRARRGVLFSFFGFSGFSYAVALFVCRSSCVLRIW